MIICFVRCKSLLYLSSLFIVSADDCCGFVFDVWCGMCIDDGYRWLFCVLNGFVYNNLSA